MAFKLILLVACAFASANAGLTLTSGSDNTYRSPGNLAQVSTQTKTIDTPYSSSSKTDVRVSNPSVYVTAQPALSFAAHASPVYATSAPLAYESHQAKLAYAAVPQVNYAQAPLAHTQAYYPQQHYQSYAAPTVYHAPQPVYTKAAYPALHVAQPATYAHPAPIAHQPIVKIAYSPANEVSHITYSNINDHINYAW